MKYLVATDGSDVSDRAIEHAAIESTAWDAPLEIVHVLTPEPKLVDGSLVIPGSETAVDHGTQLLSEAERLAETAADKREASIETSTELLAGQPADRITAYAAENGFDAIYVGHHGEADDTSNRVGSVAKSVLDKATVPVTIVK
ncbi:MAG: universal stress protein [Euryarchaeota archaeon]|nr:universal stress protein [Euryarchaeota archaeon]